MMNLETMNKKTKLVLSVVGVAAFVVPVILLVLSTSWTREIPEVPQEKRKVDIKSLEDVVRKNSPGISNLPDLSLPSTPSGLEASPGAE